MLDTTILKDAAAKKGGVNTRLATTPFGRTTDDERAPGGKLWSPIRTSFSFR
jgi:hypothetical protein